jgi:hypothetical protein
MLSSVHCSWSLESIAFRVKTGGHRSTDVGVEAVAGE